MGMTPNTREFFWGTTVAIPAYGSTRAPLPADEGVEAS